MKYEFTEVELDGFFAKNAIQEECISEFVGLITMKKFLKSKEIKELKIEVGKFYKRKDGIKAICVYEDLLDRDIPFKIFPIGFKSEGYWVKPNGVSHTCGTNDGDIIAEWSDEDEQCRRKTKR